MHAGLLSVAVALPLLGLGAATTAVTAAADGPTCSPANASRIAFGRDNHIFSVCPDGQGLVQLTRGRSIDQQPVWSPNRKHLAFVRQVSTGPSHIYRMRSDGSGIRLITGGRTDDYLPAWSPDGRRLTFTRGLSTPKIYKIRADGSHLKYITRGLAPTWSPDGSRIAISRSVSNGNSCVFLVHPIGTGLRRVTPTSISAYAPDWSPDGEWLTFQLINNATGDPSRRSSDLAIVGKDGTQLQRLTQNHEGVDEFPSWSPDGTSVAFDRIVYNEQGQITSSFLETVRVSYAAPMAGGALTQLATAPVGNVEGRDPDW